MTVQKGISAFSFIGICGAILFATLPLWFALWPETLGVTAVDLTAHILILMGMIGIYFNYADKLGKFGLIAVVGVVIGFVFSNFHEGSQWIYQTGITRICSTNVGKSNCPITPW